MSVGYDLLIPPHGLPPCLRPRGHVAGGDESLLEGPSLGTEVIFWVCC